MKGKKPLNTHFEVFPQTSDAHVLSASNPPGNEEIGEISYRLAVGPMYLTVTALQADCQRGHITSADPLVGTRMENRSEKSSKLQMLRWREKELKQ